MSYEQVFRRRVPPQADSVRVSLQHQGSKHKHRPLTMGFYIGRTVAEKLGWNVRCRVNLFWGKDKHAGMARVERAERGSFVLQVRTRSAEGSSLFFKTAQLPPHAGRPATMYATEANYIILDNGLEITLPDCLQPKQPGPYVKKHPDKNFGRPKKNSTESGHNYVDERMDRSGIQ